jgi:hypothetical protein
MTTIVDLSMADVHFLPDHGQKRSLRRRWSAAAGAERHPTPPGGAPESEMTGNLEPKWGTCYLGEQKVNRRWIMYDTQEAHLEMRWLPVTDESGRTHMEACWISVGQAHAPAHHAA